jgi:hypothetical protein
VRDAAFNKLAATAGLAIIKMRSSPMAMETLSEALRRLSTAGYVNEYRAEAEGLRNLSDGTVRRPEDFRVEQVARFEGDSDPGDECTVFALADADGGSKGTYTVTYGTLMDSLDAEMVERLPRTIA